MNQCVDCRFSFFHYGQGKCFSPEESGNRRELVVAGLSVNRATFCVIAREFGSCGTDGKHWEAKPEPKPKRSMWDRLFSWMQA